MKDDLYTYEGGRKLPLARLDTRFISRAKRSRLISDDFRPIEQVSPHSWSVETQEDRVEADIKRARRIAPAYPYYVIAETGAPFFVTDRLFLRLRAGAAIEALAARYNFEVLENLSSRDYLVQVDAHADVIDAVRSLSECEPDVELADHDLNLRLEHQSLSTGLPAADDQWYLFSTVRHRLVSRQALIDCEGAWALAGHGSRDVVVGVIDCGCDLRDSNFGDGKFAAWAALVEGELFADVQFRRRTKLMEPDNLHGTLCATLVAAGARPQHGLGVAPACRLVPVKWTPGTEAHPRSRFHDIIQFLRDKVDVVSCSWNFPDERYWPPVVNDALADAALCGGRSGRGIVWVWSAGNRNCPIQYRSAVEVPVTVERDGRTRRVSERRDEFHGSFVGFPGVVHVGAISSLGQRCHYSNYGIGLTLVAPSTNKHLYGRYRVAGRRMLAPLGVSGLHPIGGTSAAAPLVAGVAALVRSANPELTSIETVSVLKRTADKNLDMTPYPPCGRPIDPEPDWDISPIPPFDRGTFVDIGDRDGTWSPWFGFGKVNARRAVEESLRLRGRPHPPTQRPRVTP